MQDALAVAGGQHVAVRGEGYRVEHGPLAFQREQLLRAFDIPEFDSLISVAADGEPLAFWRKSDRVCALEKALQGGRLSARSGVIEVASAKNAYRGEQPPVGRESRSRYLFQVKPRVPFRRQMAQLATAFTVEGNEALVVRRKGALRHRAWSVELPTPDLASTRHVPFTEEAIFPSLRDEVIGAVKELHRQIPSRSGSDLRQKAASLDVPDLSRAFR